MLLLIGVMELSMVFFADTVLESGLREAARFGITGRSISDDESGEI